MWAATPRLIGLGLVAAAVAALGAAYGAQYLYHLEPCVLCLYQRIPYAVAGGFGILCLLRDRPAEARWIAVMAAAAFAVGAGIAFYHVGVEQHWWASAASCGGDISALGSTEALMQALQQKPAKACDETDWALFGLSMATYNVGVSAVLAALSVIAWRKIDRTGSEA